MINNILLALIVLIPFLGSLIIGFFYAFYQDRIKEGAYSFIGIGSVLTSAVLSIMVALEFFQNENLTSMSYVAFEWLHISSFVINVGFFADHLSVVMISFVTVIGTLIHIYAAGYMNKDEGYGKFFAYFNLFMGSMLLLVLGDNPIMLFIGWEGVGLCSYLLISYYHKDTLNVKAGNKAFILNRIGDFGFLIGMLLLFIYGGAGGFTFGALETNVSTVPSAMLTAIALLLFVGAMGKSAQIPLYVWLPDAMAGPTPVSALIHAATMVTAGVYMVARFAFVYNLTPDVGLFIAYIGAFSALFAALIASHQSDIKKILAYSTMSQLGYMFIAAGLGLYSGAIFHVFTHAFFKALLFMGAGVLIVAVHHKQDIFDIRMHRALLPITFVTMLIATLAISGVPPFAGFFSKDAIMAHAFASGHYGIWLISTITALLTAYYMFRLFFTVFFGAREKELHKINSSMQLPLIILAIGAALTGLLNLPHFLGGENQFSNWISTPDKALHLSISAEWVLTTLNVILSGIGIFFAWKHFGRNPQPSNAQLSINNLLLNKFYVDEVYDTIFVKNIRRLSYFFSTIIDVRVISEIIKQSSSGYFRLGVITGRMQNGNVRFYALYMVAGIIGMSIYLLEFL